MSAWFLDSELSTCMHPLVISPCSSNFLVKSFYIHNNSSTFLDSNIPNCSSGVSAIRT